MKLVKESVIKLNIPVLEDSSSFGPILLLEEQDSFSIQTPRSTQEEIISWQSPLSPFLKPENAGSKLAVGDSVPETDQPKTIASGSKGVGVLESVPGCDTLPLGILMTDQEGLCVYANSAYQKLTGLSRADLLGTHWASVIHSQDREMILAQWRGATENRQAFVSEARVSRPDGSEIWVRRNVDLVSSARPSSGYVHTVEDITELKREAELATIAEELLYEEKERAQVTLNSIGDAVISTDEAGTVTFMNVVAERMTGWSLGEAEGKPLLTVFNILDAETREGAPSPAERAMARNDTVGLATDCLLVNRDGVELSIEDSAAPIRNRHGVITGAVIVFRDVKFSEQMTDKMKYLAQHDALTGLPNRTILSERLSHALGFASRHQKQLGLLFVDVDNFKQINDAFGHSVGDKVLIDVANQLTDYVRKTDTVCRWGGDEFIILLSELEHPDDAAAVAAKLKAAVATPRVVDGHYIVITLSIGISLYPDQGEDPEALLSSADSAMYQSKKAGKHLSAMAVMH